MQQGDITGVVLAGGTSSRLGFDKSGIVLSTQVGEDLLSRSVRILRFVVPRVVVVGKSHPDFESFPDDESECGPVGGIFTALRRLMTPCLVLACDMPFMNVSVLDLLIKFRMRRSSRALLSVYENRETGIKEMLAAIYEPQSIEYFRSSLSSGLLKLSLVVPPEFHHAIQYSASDALPFFTVNYPSDLAAARLIVSLTEKRDD
jgi:molybdopterin-guanine dinucleotide biosynthesis protein A